jgi:hypothetical protein
MASRRLKRRLKIADLPTFGRPTIATVRVGEAADDMGGIVSQFGARRNRLPFSPLCLTSNMDIVEM